MAAAHHGLDTRIFVDPVDRRRFCARNRFLDIDPLTDGAAFGQPRLRTIKARRSETTARVWPLFSTMKRVDFEMLPTNQFVEVRNRAYYVAGTRIGLDVVIREFRDGRSPEEIFDAYASIGSLSRVYGAITFILEHPQEIDSYLEAQDDKWEAFKTRIPLPSDMIERFERAKRDISVKRH